MTTYEYTDYPDNHTGTIGPIAVVDGAIWSLLSYLGAGTYISLNGGGYGVDVARKYPNFGTLPNGTNTVAFSTLPGDGELDYSVRIGIPVPTPLTASILAPAYPQRPITPGSLAVALGETDPVNGNSFAFNGAWRMLLIFNSMASGEDVTIYSAPDPLNRKADIIQYLLEPNVPALFWVEPVGWQQANGRVNFKASGPDVFAGAILIPSPLPILGAVTGPADSSQDFITMEYPNAVPLTVANVLGPYPIAVSAGSLDQAWQATDVVAGNSYSFGNSGQFILIIYNDSFFDEHLYAVSKLDPFNRLGHLLTYNMLPGTINAMLFDSTGWRQANNTLIFETYALSIKAIGIQL